MKRPDENELLQRGELPDDPEADTGPPLPLPILEDAEVRRAAGPAPARTWAERVRAAGEVMARRASGDERPMATPWPGVNKALRGGFWPAAYSLTSSTGAGKSQWAIQCALHLAERFKADHDSAVAPAPEGPDRVLYVALELGETDLVARMFGVMAAGHVAALRDAGTTEHEVRDSGLARLWWSDLFFGVDPETCKPGEDRVALLQAVQERFADRLAALPIHLETPPTRGWGSKQFEALVADVKPRFVVLDYAQLMSAPEGGREDIRQTIGNVAKSARQVARQPNGPAVLILSSTARANYGKVDGASEESEPDNGKPRKRATPLGEGNAARLAGLGKESGDLEFTVDCALVLAAEQTPEGQAATEEKKVWLAVAKGRGFRTGWTLLGWNGNAFREWPGDGASEPVRTAPLPPKRRSKAPQPERDRTGGDV